MNDPGVSYISFRCALFRHTRCTARAAATAAAASGGRCYCNGHLFTFVVHTYTVYDRVYYIPPGRFSKVDRRTTKRVPIPNETPSESSRLDVSNADRFWHRHYIFQPCGDIGKIGPRGCDYTPSYFGYIRIRASILHVHALAANLVTCDVIPVRQYVVVLGTKPQ